MCWETGAFGEVLVNVTIAILLEKMVDDGPLRRESMGRIRDNKPSMTPIKWDEGR